MNKYEQRFFSRMQETFIGHKTEGKSGYANLLDLKYKYFSQIEPYIKSEIEKKIEENAREELYQKLYTFFDAYLNETGTVFFANTHIHKNVYEKIYDDRNDVMLFWKTKQLYYVKTEAFYDNLETEVGTTTFMFDASELKHKKANEKKELAFYLTEVQKDKVKFKVRYKTNNDFSRLKEILELDKNNAIIDYLLDNYGSNENPEIIYSPTTLNRDFFTKKGDKRKNLYIELQDDLQKSIKVEYSISDFNLIFNYLTGNQIIIDEDDLKKAFTQYKRQKEVDYFIHKNAEAFLKEQFDIYMYNWLFNDTKSQFDEATVKRMQNIKIIAYEIIEYIARFEEELKAVWQKPKFVRKSNYVITIDKLNDKLIKKIEKHTNLKDQISEWQELGFIDNDFNFENIYETDLTGKHLTEKYKHLPIDTKYFKDIEYEILDIFEHLDKVLDGVLIKSDNWQALNTLKEKYKERIQAIYIDPPFNTNSSPIIYVNNYKDSSWLTLIDNRIEQSLVFLKNDGINIVAIDDIELRYLTTLLDNRFGKHNYLTTITTEANPQGRVSDLVSKTTEFHILHSKNKNHINGLSVIKFGNKKPTSLKRTGTNSRREERPNRYYPILIKDGKINMITDEEYSKIYDKKNKIFNDDFVEELKKKYESLGYYFLLPTKNDGTKLVWQRIFDRVKKEKNNYIVKNNMVYTPSFDFEIPKTLWKEALFSNPEYGSEYLKHILGHSKFETPKSFYTIKQFFSMFDNSGFYLDYFGGSGTTADAIIKMNQEDDGDRKFILCELGDHFNTVIIPRIKKISFTDKWKDGKAQDGGIGYSNFFKYYELEQYEEVLAKAQYQWREKDSDIEKYTFMQDQKLLEAIEIDYEKKNAKLVFEKLYDDIDLAETFSNLLGKSIKKVAKDYCILTDHDGNNEMKIDYNNLTFEKYPFVKPLIWWQSK